MADERDTRPFPEHRPVEAEGVPAEEGISRAEVAEGAERTPDGQLNRPDQPDADPAEKRQYEDPPLTEPASDGSSQTR